ncbi:MAG: phosphoribosyl-ATP diphosphatase, partial [Dehalococcoidia bacterium]|nr:phosphoribosyl-ATP diphosphatase [Dehalococcoidia bacterium]
IKLDCDGDTLLLEVDAKGPACHTGEDSCFNTELPDLGNCNFIGADTNRNIFMDLFSIIEDRKLNPKNASYTNKLFNEGVSRIAQKVVEEAGETAIAGVTGQKEELASEISDLIYHVFVLISANNMSLEQVFQELSTRRESGK